MPTTSAEETPFTTSPASRVQCTKTTSDYYGQVGLVVQIQTGRTDNGPKHLVEWPDGHKAFYYRSSLVEANVPISRYLHSPGQWRSKRKTTVHIIPASRRPLLVAA